MKPLSFVIAILLLLPFSSRADDSLPSKFFKLDFVVQEIDGVKVINSREYHVLGADGSNCSIRTSSAIPYSTGPSTGMQTGTYNLSVDIDAARLRDVENGLALNVMATVISVPADLDTKSMPVVRKNSWSSTLLVPLRKATVIFSSDDLSSKHKIQVVLTATPLK